MSRRAWGSIKRTNAEQMVQNDVDVACPVPLVGHEPAAPYQVECAAAVHLPIRQRAPDAVR